MLLYLFPCSLICSRLEANVLRVINPHLMSAKDANVKQNLIRAVELIGKAVQPKHVQRDDFIFTRRSELLKHMKVNNLVNNFALVLVYLVILYHIHKDLPYIMILDFSSNRYLNINWSCQFLKDGNRLQCCCDFANHTFPYNVSGIKRFE